MSDDDIETPSQTLMELGRHVPQYTRPLTSWEEIAQAHPLRLEVRWFLRQRESDRASWWYRHRAQAPCDAWVPPEWGLDALYQRHEAARGYCERLRELREPIGTSGLSAALAYFSPPWVPFIWPSTANAVRRYLRQFSTYG